MSGGQLLSLATQTLLGEPLLTLEVQRPDYLNSPATGGGIPPTVRITTFISFWLTLITWHSWGLMLSFMGM